MDTVKLPEKWSEWKVEEVLGSGSYGTVYKVFRQFNEQRFYSAVKVIEIPSENSDAEFIRRDYSNEDSLRLYYKDLVDSCVDEIKTMDSLKGTSNIVSIEDYCVEECKDRIGWNIYIRMEYLQSFAEYIKTHKMSEADVIKAGIDICNALEQCEKLNIIHRDIKMDNMFVSPLGFVKLGDFGVARQMEKSVYSYSSKGTFSYMAPEVYHGKKYGKQADIYSLGIVMYRLMNRNRDPFVDPDKQMIYYRDKEDALRKRMEGGEFPKPVDASDEFAAVIQKACRFHPEGRYRGASDLKRDLIKLQNGTRVRKHKKNNRGKDENKENRNRFANMSDRGAGILCAVAVIVVMLLTISIASWRLRSKDEGLTDVDTYVAEIMEKEEKTEESEVLTADSKQEGEQQTAESEKGQTETDAETTVISAELPEYDISGCADFSLSTEENGGKAKRYLFGNKLIEILKEAGADDELAEEIAADITLDDFELDYSDNIEKGTIVTMSFVGQEKIENDYQVTLYFQKIAKQYN